LFEDQIARIPPRPPRRASELSGLRWSSLASRGGWVLPIALAALFTFMPLMIFSADPHARLAYGHTDVAKGRVVSVDALLEAATVLNRLGDLRAADMLDARQVGDAAGHFEHPMVAARR
jgi:hypothetical protein